jgi:IS4 transposase
VCRAQGLTPNSCNYFYTNLQSLYNKHKYNFDHIWNYDETRIQVGRQSRARVLARKRSNAVYSTIPKSWKWLTINYAINVTGGVLLGLYIFKGERLRDDYIALCKPGTCMVMQKRAWMTTFLFKEFLSFFNKLGANGMSFNNQHLLILNGHGSHVT